MDAECLVALREATTASYPLGNDCFRERITNELGRSIGQARRGRPLKGASAGYNDSESFFGRRSEKMKALLRRFFYETRSIQLAIQWAERNRFCFSLLVAALFVLISYDGRGISVVAGVIISIPISFYFCKLNDLNRNYISIPAPPFHVKITSPDDAMFWRPISFLFFLILMTFGLIVDHLR